MDLAGRSRRRIKRKKSRVKKSCKADGKNTENRQEMQGEEANEPAGQDSPAVHDPPAVHDSPAAQNSPAGHDSPAVHDPPAAHDSPAAQDPPAGHDSPAVHDSPAAQDSPAGQDLPTAQDPSVFHLTRVIPTIHTWGVDSRQESDLPSNSSCESYSCSNREYDSDETDSSVSVSVTDSFIPKFIMRLQVYDEDDDDSSEGSPERSEKVLTIPGKMKTSKSSHQRPTRTQRNTNPVDRRSSRLYELLEDTVDPSPSEKALCDEYTAEADKEWDKVHQRIKTHVKSRRKPGSESSRRAYPSSDISLGPGHRPTRECPSELLALASCPDFPVVQPRRNTKAWGSPSKDRMSLTDKEEAANYQPTNLRGPASRIHVERESANTQILTLVRKLVKMKDQSACRLRWLKAIKLVCHTLRISNSMTQRSNDISEIHPNFIDMGDSSVVADETMYKVGIKHGFNIMQDEEQTLMMEPEERTEHQISMLLYNLQLIRSFCEFPLRTQREIAKHAFYIRVKKKRVIVRQGQVALHYYFILRGQAIVTEVMHSENGSYCKTHAILTEGEGFGDNAITQQCMRTLTVSSRSSMQLLMLTKQDYISIFLPERFTDGIPDYIKYLDECSWMKGFPVEELLNNPQKCSARYFRHRQLIVADSTNNDYLYVIRNGRCHVLMLIDSEKTSWKDLEPLWKKQLNQSNKYLDVFQAQDKKRMKVIPVRKPVSTSDVREQSFVPWSAWRRRTLLPGTTQKSIWDEHEQNQVASVLNRAIGSAPASRKNTMTREYQQRRFTEGSLSFREDNQVASVLNRAMKSAPASRKNSEKRDHQQLKFSEDNQVSSVLNRGIKSALASRKNTEKKDHQQRKFSEDNQVSSVLNRGIKSALASRKNTEKKDHQQRKSSEDNQVSSVLNRGIKSEPASRKNTEKKDHQQRKFSEDNQVSSVLNRGIKSELASRKNTEKRDHQQRSFTEGSLSFSEDSLSAHVASSRTKSFRDSREENQAPAAAFHKKSTSTRPCADIIHQVSPEQNADSPQSTSLTRRGPSFRTTSSSAPSLNRKITTGSLLPDFVKDVSDFTNLRPASVSVVDDPKESVAEAGLEMSIGRLMKEMMSFADDADTETREQRCREHSSSLHSEISVIFVDDKGNVVPGGNRNYNSNSENYHINTNGNNNKDNNSNSKDCNSKDDAGTNASVKGHGGSASNTIKEDQAGDSNFRKGHAARDSKNNTGRGGIKKANNTRDAGSSASAKWRAGSSFNSKGDEGNAITSTKGDAGTTTNKKGKVGTNTINKRDSSTNRKEYAHSINNSNKQEAGSVSIRNKGNRSIKGHASSNSGKGDEGTNSKGSAVKNSKNTGDTGNSRKNGDSSDSVDSSGYRNTTHHRNNNHTKIKENDNKHNTVGTNRKSKSVKIHPETRENMSTGGRQKKWLPDIIRGHSPDSLADVVFVGSEISEFSPDLLPEPSDGAGKDSLKPTPDVSGSSGSSCDSETVTKSNLRRRPRRHYRPPEKEGEISSWAKRRLYTVPLECRPRTRCCNATGKEEVQKVFVEMEILGPGDVFGFDQLNLPWCMKQKTHKVSLVSDGAEVIMIHKRLFAQHANVWVQQAVQKLTRAYPSPEKVQYTRRMHVAWEKYKEKIQKDYKYSGVVVFQPGPTMDPLASVGMIPDTR